MNDVTILVNSCDKYESVWDPFFRLLLKQWPECKNYKFVLNSETKTYNCDFLNVKTVCGGTKVTWSQRLKNVLHQIESEYVLYFLEDFFLLQKVSNDTLLEAVNYMKENADVGYIGLKYNPVHNFKNESQVDFSSHFLNKDDVITVNRVNSMTALWRKDWLISLLRKHETPWEFEIYGSIRSRRTPQKVMILNNINGVCKPVFDYGVDIKYGYGVTMGCWLPKNVELFEENGITADFDILGINYELYEKANSEPTASTQTENLPQKKNLRERLYKVKHSFKKLKKKTIKTVRKIRSLI